MTDIVIHVEGEAEAALCALNYAQRDRVVQAAARAASNAIAEILLIEGAPTAEEPRGILSASSAER